MDGYLFKLDKIPTSSSSIVRVHIHSTQQGVFFLFFSSWNAPKYLATSSVPSLSLKDWFWCCKHDLFHLHWNILWRHAMSSQPQSPIPQWKSTPDFLSKNEMPWNSAWVNCPSTFKPLKKRGHQSHHVLSSINDNTFFTIVPLSYVSTCCTVTSWTWVNLKSEDMNIWHEDIVHLLTWALPKRWLQRKCQIWEGRRKGI